MNLSRYFDHKIRLSFCSCCGQLEKPRLGSGKKTVTAAATKPAATKPAASKPAAMKPAAKIAEIVIGEEEEWTGTRKEKGTRTRQEKGTRTRTPEEIISGQGMKLQILIMNLSISSNSDDFGMKL